MHKFTFKTNLNQTITATVLAKHMREAMHKAAQLLGVKECNLIFIQVKDL